VEIEIKGLCQLLFVFLEKPLYEICLIRINERTGKKSSSVGTQMNTDCLLKTKNMLSTENSGILMISVSENVLVESMWLVSDYGYVSGVFVVSQFLSPLELLANVIKSGVKHTKKWEMKDKIDNSAFLLATLDHSLQVAAH